MRTRYSTFSPKSGSRRDIKSRWPSKPCSEVLSTAKCSINDPAQSSACSNLRSETVRLMLLGGAVRISRISTANALSIFLSNSFETYMGQYFQSTYSEDVDFPHVWKASFWIEKQEPCGSFRVRFSSCRQQNTAG